MIGSLLVATTQWHIICSPLHRAIVIDVKTRFDDHSRPVITELLLLKSDGIVEHECFIHIDEHLKNFEVCCLVG